MQRIRWRYAVATVVLLGSVALASGEGSFPTDLLPDDRERLERFDEVRAEAVSNALAGANPEDRETLLGILEGSPIPIVWGQILGEWQCRTAKLDGALPVIVYDFFLCRIYTNSDGLHLMKLTGSQRTTGTFHIVEFAEGEDRLGYVGAQSWGRAEGPIRYGEDPLRDEVGYLIRIEPNRMRLELPSPRVESSFDILELRR